MVSLRAVTPEDYRFLYELLAEKTPEQNISHKEMPTWEEHCSFNNQQPYAKDWIILADGERVGRIYLTKEREIGIHIACPRKGIGAEALKLVIYQAEKPIYANISPLNKGSQEFFQRHGFKLLQLTYKLE